MTQITQQTKLRALVKAVVWTMLGLVVMILVGFALTGSLETGGKMAIINSAIGLLNYFLYERFWDRIKWGRHGASEAL